MNERWIIEAGQVVGCPIGTEIEVERDDGEWRIVKPGVGVMARLDPRTAHFTTTDDEDDRMSIHAPTEGLDLRLVRSRPAPGVDGPPPTTLIRTYRAPAADAAVAAFETDVPLLEQRGYSIVSQSWAEPRRPGVILGVLAALFAFTALFGFLSSAWIFAIVLSAIALLCGIAYSTGPAIGALTVTYGLRAGMPAVGADVSAEGSPSLAAGDRMRQLEQLRTDGLISADEYSAKRAEIFATL